MAVYHFAMLAGMFGGAALYCFQMRKLDVAWGRILSSLPLAVAIPVAFARIVDTAVYRPEELMDRPWELMRVLSGGLSSHGAILGLIILVPVLAQLFQRSAWVIGDKIVIWALFGVAATRVADHMHGQGIGTASGLPWATTLHDQVARHPTHIYEIVLVVMLFALHMMLTRRWSVSRPGTGAAVVMLLYFIFRVPLDGMREVAHLSDHSSIAIGQLLSAPFILFFLVLTGLRFRFAKPAPKGWPAPTPPLNGIFLGPRRAVLGAVLCVLAAGVLGSAAQQIVTGARAFGFNPTPWNFEHLSLYFVFWVLPMSGMTLVGVLLGRLLEEWKQKTARTALSTLVVLVAFSTSFYMMQRVNMSMAACAWAAIAVVFPFRYGIRHFVVYVIAGWGAVGVCELMYSGFEAYFPVPYNGPMIIIYFGLGGVLASSVFEKTAYGKVRKTVQHR